MPESVPQRVGEYEILRELGRGGMGIVYLASVEGAVPGVPAGERVALKVIWPHLVADSNVFERFIQEASLGRRIRHENVVRTLDAGMEVRDDGETVYLAMEHVVGRTLAQVREQMGRVPEGLCRRVARDVARALAGIHEMGVVHGDLKPENVLITADEVVKVMDLGLARLTDRTRRISQTGEFAGSFLYAAPEQFSAEGTAFDGRADLYALGVTLYELAAGEHPFAHDDLRVVMHRQVHDEPRPLRDVNPEVSPLFAAVVHCLMEKDASRRFRTAGELFRVLSRAEESRWWRNRGRAAARVHETDIHGRETELAELRRLHAEAKQGRGACVIIKGEDGIGRTRLVEEFVASLDAADAVTVDGDRLLLGTAPTRDVEIRLPRLLRDAVASLVADATEDETPDARLVDWIMSRSDGNPLVALEWLRDLRAADLLALPPCGRPVPPAVRDLLLPRVAQLAADDRDLVEAAACIGHEFSADLLASVTGIEKRALLRRLADVEDATGVVRATRTGFVFDSRALCDVVHEATQEMLRLEYHRVLAETLAARPDANAADVCRHAFASGDPSAAGPFLDAALAHLDSKGSFAEAADLAARALAAPGLVAGAARTRALVRRAAALSALGRDADVRAALREAIDAGD